MALIWGDRSSKSIELPIFIMAVQMLTTQVTTHGWEAALFWHKQGFTIQGNQWFQVDIALRGTSGQNYTILTPFEDSQMIYNMPSER